MNIYFLNLPEVMLFTILIAFLLYKFFEMVVNSIFNIIDHYIIKP